MHLTADGPTLFFLRLLQQLVNRSCFLLRKFCALVCGYCSSTVLYYKLTIIGIFAVSKYIVQRFYTHAKFSYFTTYLLLSSI